MVVVVAVAALAAVVALGILGWPARTVRLRTSVLALLVGVFCAAPAAALAGFVWTRLLGAVTGSGPAAVVRVAGFTLDPFLEQAAVLVPVGLTWLLPRVRRQWAATDFVLLAGAGGAGLWLAGTVLRLTARPGAAEPPVHWADLLLLTGWGALGGLGLAWLLREPNSRLRTAGLVVIAFTGLDRVAHGWRATGGSGAVADALTWPFTLVRQPALEVLLALAIAVWSDRERYRRAVAAELDDRTPAERDSRSPAGLVRAAGSRLPRSALLVAGLVRIRRAYRTSTVRAPGATLGDELREAVVALRDRVAGLPDSPKGGRARALQQALRSVLRIPRPGRGLPVWWAGLALPVLFGLVGGFPSTAGMRRALASGPATPLVVLLALLALGWAGRGAVDGFRTLPKWREHPYGEVAVSAAARPAIGAAAVLAAVPVLFGLLAGGSRGPLLPDAAEGSPLSTSGPHLLAALGDASPVAVLALLACASALFPPGGRPGDPAVLPAALGRLGASALGGASAPNAPAERGSATTPSLEPDPAARAEGDPAELGARLPRDVTRARRRANETADALRRAGYDVRRLPPDPDGKGADVEIEGRPFEIKAPRSANPETVRSLLRASGRRPGQRFVLNLDDSQLTVEELREGLRNRPGSRVGEVIVVRGGRVTPVLPERGKGR